METSNILNQLNESTLSMQLMSDYKNETYQLSNNDVADLLVAGVATTPNSYTGITTMLLNSTNITTLPPNLVFNENSLVGVIVYSLLFVLAAVGNLTVFITLFRSRHRKSRINLMITHLAVADLMVTFIMIPLEVSSLRLRVIYIPTSLKLSDTKSYSLCLRELLEGENLKYLNIIMIQIDESTTGTILMLLKGKVPKKKKPSTRGNAGQ